MGYSVFQITFFSTFGSKSGAKLPTRYKIGLAHKARSLMKNLHGFSFSTQSRPYRVDGFP